MTDFQVAVYQNEYLPEGGRAVDAIVTVTATGAPEVTGTRTAEVIVVDTSGSMDYPPTKLTEAKRATSAAIDLLPDGVLFAIVAGTEVARPVYPTTGAMAVASAATRAEAKVKVAGLMAGGGTAIGQWLALADRLLAEHRDATRHVILLTDGKNEHETPEALAATLQQVSGHFVCDCRGVGTAWVVDELRRISTALLGTVDIIAEPSGLAEDFRKMTASALGKTISEVSLRLWTPEGAVVRFVKQAAPVQVDLTGRRTESGPRTGDYPTGSWGAESRDYHVSVEVPPAGVGERMLAARASLVRTDTGEVLGQGRVLATWTDDLALSTRISPEVALHTNQAELAEVIQEGLEARRAGDVERATAKLGRAVALAEETGNEGTAKLLAKVVEVEPRTGTIRLRRQVATADEMTLDTRSTVTKRVGGQG